MSDLTIVTGIWDLGRERATGVFHRPFDHYLEKFAQLLVADVPMVIFGDESLRSFVSQHRAGRPTDFRVRSVEQLRKDFEFYGRVQSIRQDPAWLAQAGWLPESTQASLEMYNPMVMSKMFMLHDASIWNSFNTAHFAWIDGGITHTVHPGYFTHDRCFEKVVPLLDKFFFVTFPYTGGGEVHGFARAGMREFCGEDSAYVCRGGFFGGHKELISEVNAHYHEVLSASLHQGYMGTEESVFTIMTYDEPELYDRFALTDEHAGLLQYFFEHVKGLPLPTPKEPTRAAERTVRRRGSIDISGKTVDGYIVTFNAPDQLEQMLRRWTPEFRFDRLFILDHSTEADARAANRALIDQYDAVELAHPNGNGGINGGRQLVAEHFAANGANYYVFLEDDMFLNGAATVGVCKNGLRLSVPQLRDVLLKIMELEQYDFLKLSFTEFFGDNRTQFAWYNVPQAVREQYWPQQSTLPAKGLDPDSPRTRFENIGSVDGVAYVDGEVFYCNWPQIVSRAGNQRMFLDTVWAHPFEQTWMSHMYQLTVAGKLRPAVLLASVITHDRFHHYHATERREN